MLRSLLIGWSTRDIVYNFHGMYRVRASIPFFISTNCLASFLFNRSSAVGPSLLIQICKFGTRCVNFNSIDQNLWDNPRWNSQMALYCVCVCVCVCFLPIHSGHQVRWTYQPGSHRISHTPSFCGACLNFSREKDSAVPFPRRPWSRILCTNDLIVLHPLGIFI